MSDDVVRRYNGARPIQAPAQLLADAIREVEVLREENARLRRLVKTAYAEGCYDSTKTEKTQEEFEALWKESFAYNVILEGGKVKAEAACLAPDEGL